MIVVENLTKVYGARVAVDNVNFNIAKGEIVGFLGPNGAGKSTTMRMLTGFLSPTAGRVTIGGHDMAENPIEAKQLLGYLPESPPLYPEMTVRDYLNFVAQLKGLDKAKRKERLAFVLEKCFLQDRVDQVIGQLSKGYKQRVGIAQALIHNPPVLILDEPTSGLDPQQIIQIRALIAELAVDHTIILSTHILPEVQTTCNRVLIISGGKLVAEGSAEQLEAQLQGGMRVEMLVRATPGRVHGRPRRGRHGAFRSVRPHHRRADRASRHGPPRAPRQHGGGRGLGPGRAQEREPQPRGDLPEAHHHRGRRRRFEGDRPCLRSSPSPGGR